MKCTSIILLTCVMIQIACTSCASVNTEHGFGASEYVHFPAELNEVSNTTHGTGKALLADLTSSLLTLCDSTTVWVLTERLIGVKPLFPSRAGSVSPDLNPWQRWAARLLLLLVLSPFLHAAYSSLYLEWSRWYIRRHRDARTAFIDKTNAEKPPQITIRSRIELRQNAAKISKNPAKKRVTIQEPETSSKIAGHSVYDRKQDLEEPVLFKTTPCREIHEHSGSQHDANSATSGNKLSLLNKKRAKKRDLEKTVTLTKLEEPATKQDLEGENHEHRHAEHNASSATSGNKLSLLTKKRATKRDLEKPATLTKRRLSPSRKHNEDKSQKCAGAKRTRENGIISRPTKKRATRIVKHRESEERTATFDHQDIKHNRDNDTTDGTPGRMLPGPVVPLSEYRLGYYRNCEDDVDIAYAEGGNEAVLVLGAHTDRPVQMAIVDAFTSGEVAVELPDEAYIRVLSGRTSIRAAVLDLLRADRARGECRKRSVQGSQSLDGTCRTASVRPDLSVDDVRSVSQPANPSTPTGPSVNRLVGQHIANFCMDVFLYYMIEV